MQEANTIDTQAQARRDAALARLQDTRAAEQAATEEHHAATQEWLAATCGKTERSVGWCTEAIGHDGDHRNLRGATWSAIA